MRAAGDLSGGSVVDGLEEVTVEDVADVAVERGPVARDDYTPYEDINPDYFEFSFESSLSLSSIISVATSFARC